MHARRAEAAEDEGRARPGEVGEGDGARLLRRLRPGYPQVCDALVDAEGDLARVRARAWPRAGTRARARAQAWVDAEGDHVGGNAEEQQQQSLLGEVQQPQVLPHQCVEEAGRRRHPSVGIVVVTLVVTDQAQPRQLRGGGARVRPRGRRGTRLCSEEDSGRVWSSGWQWLTVAGQWLAGLSCGKAGEECWEECPATATGKRGQVRCAVKQVGVGDVTLVVDDRRVRGSPGGR